MEDCRVKKKEIKTQDMKRLAIYRKYLRTNPDLRVLFFELTDRCNLRCRHCGSSCEPSNANYADTAALLRLLSEINRDFPDPDFMICLTGGEPLLHPDFEVIANAVNNAGLPWGMTTFRNHPYCVPRIP
ncbi:4Fe-4S single cluster domain-containing protein [Lachnospiraceae bacterium XBB2008]|nr:4Fe-4S single cluster domain-containing protein [Lachnospiraceae bacterium XBB2008]